MSTFRAITRLIRFLFITWFYHSVILLGNVLSKFGFNNTALNSSIRMRWARSVMKILHMKLTVHGIPPKPPFFLVSNHLSYLDVWALYGTSKGTFITKSDVKDWPVVGLVLRTSGLIFVDRERKADVTRVNDEIAKSINKDQGIFLFPEGTTSAGEGLLPFKSSLFQLPAAKQLEVTSAAISYDCKDERVEPSDVICWWNDVPFGSHFWNVLKLKEFQATITYSDQKLIDSNRKKLASSTYSIIQDIFEPVKQPRSHAK